MFKKLLAITAVAIMAMPVNAKQFEIVDKYVDFSTVSSLPWGWNSDSAEKTISLSDGCLYFKNEEKKDFWDIQYWLLGGMAFDANATYTVSLYIKGTVPGRIATVKLGGWSNGTSKSVEFTDEWSEVSVDLTGIDGGDGLMLQHGDYVGEFWIKWVKVTHSIEKDPDFICLSATNIKEALVPRSNGDAHENWDQQMSYTFPTPIPAGKYVFTCDVIGDVEQTITINNIYNDGTKESTGYGYWGGMGDPKVTTAWTKHTHNVTVNEGTVLLKFDIKFGDYTGDELHFDNFTLVKEGDTENLIEDGRFEIPTVGNWTRNGWWESETGAHNCDFNVDEGPGHFTAVPTLEGWSTFCCDKPLKFKDNVDVYKAVGVNNNNYITLEKIEGVVPANTGILVDGQAAATLDILETVEEGEALEGNLLKAAFAGEVVAASDASATRYVFGTQNDVTGFFRVANNMTVPAGKNVAYLELPVAASKAPRCIVIDGGNVTAISDVAVDTENADNAIYNLQGVRVDKPVKGLYIVNGKKVVY